MTLNKYQKAALVYLVYAMTYLFGIVYLAYSGSSDRLSENTGTLGYMLSGALVTVVFPILIWRGYRWFARIIAVFLVFRIYYVVKFIASGDPRTVPTPWGSEFAMLHGAMIFLVVTVAACAALVWASWMPERKVASQ